MRGEEGYDRGKGGGRQNRMQGAHPLRSRSQPVGRVIPSSSTLPTLAPVPALVLALIGIQPLTLVLIAIRGQLRDEGLEWLLLLLLLLLLLAWLSQGIFDGRQAFLQEGGVRVVTLPTHEGVALSEDSSSAPMCRQTFAS